MTARTASAWRSGVSALVVSGMLLAGCTTQAQRIGADDGSDVCRTYRVALDSTGDFFGEDMVKGAAIGAVGGALAGLLVGGDARSAAIGAVAGAALGAAGGYWQSKQQQTKDQAVLYQGVLTDIQRENLEIDKTQTAFNKLVDCRKNQAKVIRADLAAGRIAKPAYDQRMKAVRTAYDKDIEIARNITKNIKSRSDNFLYANEQMNPGTSARITQTAQSQAGRVHKPRPAAGTAASPQQAKQRTIEATETNVVAAQALASSVETAAMGASGFV